MKNQNNRNIPTAKPVPIPKLCDALSHVPEPSTTRWSDIIEAVRADDIAKFEELLIDSSTPTITSSPESVYTGDLNTIVDEISNRFLPETRIDYIQMIVNRHPSILGDVNIILASHNLLHLTITTDESLLSMSEYSDLPSISEESSEISSIISTTEEDEWTEVNYRDLAEISGSIYTISGL
jgi:hypothetical protein